MSEKRLIKIAIPIIIFLFSLFTLCSIVIFSTFKKRESVLKEEEYSYQFLNIGNNMNPIIGITTMNRKLEVNEFISHSDHENGNRMLISNIGEDEYQCSGTCYCTTEEIESSNRKNIIGIPSSLSKSVKYLLVAATSLIAYEIAKEHFDDECRTQLSSECNISPYNIIQSEVDECAVLSYKPNPEIETSEDLFEEMYDDLIQTGKTDSVEEEGPDEVYLCKGKCLPNLYYDLETRREKLDPKIRKEVLRSIDQADCEKMELTENWKASTIQRTIATKTNKLKKTPEDIITGIWSSSRLRDFCEGSTVKKFLDAREENKKKKRLGDTNFVVDGHRVETLVDIVYSLCSYTTGEEIVEGKYHHPDNICKKLE